MSYLLPHPFRIIDCFPNISRYLSKIEFWENIVIPLHTYSLHFVHFFPLKSIHLIQKTYKMSFNYLNLNWTLKFPALRALAHVVTRHLIKKLKVIPEKFLEKIYFTNGSGSVVNTFVFFEAEGRCGSIDQSCEAELGRIKTSSGNF
jgi:hypothetical protein